MAKTLKRLADVPAPPAPAPAAMIPEPRTPAELIAAVNRAAVSLPPAAMPAADRNGMLSMRFRESSLGAIARAAQARGLTQKVFVALALRAAGAAIAEADLTDGTRARHR